jgi:hypothetical protein
MANSTALQAATSSVGARGSLPPRQVSLIEDGGREPRAPTEEVAATAQRYSPTGEQTLKTNQDFFSNEV